MFLLYSCLVIIYQKAWSQSCCPFHGLKALALPCSLERATMKAPTQNVIAITIHI